MPKYTVHLRRTIIEARVVEVELCGSPERAHQIALRMSRHVDAGGEIKQGCVGEWCDGIPRGRTTVTHIEETK